MIFVYIPLIVLVAIIILLLIRKYTSLEFVDHARLLWRAWSVRFAVLAALIQGIAADTPQSILNAWNSLPPDIKSVLSPETMHYISGALIAASFLSQYVRQPRLKERADQLRDNR